MPSATIKAVVAMAGVNAAAAAPIPANVAILMEGVLKGMILTKLKTVAVVLLMFGVATVGASLG